MITKSIILIPLLTLQLMMSAHSFQESMPYPVQLNKESIEMTQVKNTLKFLNAPTDKIDKLAKGCLAAKVATDIDPHLIATLSQTECGFDVKAKSSMGYKGLMQTKRSHMKWDYAEVDIINGACVLREKLTISNGNMEAALTYYKGSPYMFKGKTESVGHKQSVQVLDLYKKVLLNKEKLQKG